MKLLLFAVCAAAFARADFVATLVFAGEEPYDPTKSCSFAPAMYEMMPMCRSIPSGPWGSASITCINRTTYAEAEFSSSDCSGVPAIVVPPQAVSPAWCQPYPFDPQYTATIGACLPGDYMASSPDSGMMSLAVLLNTPNQLCPNPDGPVVSATLTVQACSTNRTCSLLGSAFSIVKECVAAGEPVPPPFVPPPA